MDRNTLVKRFVIGTFITLYALVSIISTIHVIDFFELSNPYWLAVTLAIGFEIGAAASLASLVILKKMNKTLVWALFITITLMQMQGNMYYAFINLTDFGSWSELFDLIDEDLIDQKRILAFVSGAILPLIALGFIKSLVDYIRPEQPEVLNEIPNIETPVAGSAEPVTQELYEDHITKIIPDVSEELLGEDLYSRDAKEAIIPAEIGEVHIAPKIVKTDDAVANVVEKPVPMEHITPVGDPIVIPTPETQEPSKPIKPPLTSRPFIRAHGIESKP